MVTETERNRLELKIMSSDFKLWVVPVGEKEWQKMETA